jgi:hypothetical protein
MKLWRSMNNVPEPEHEKGYSDFGTKTVYTGPVDLGRDQFGNRIIAPAGSYMTSIDDSEPSNELTDSPELSANYTPW